MTRKKILASAIIAASGMAVPYAMGLNTAASTEVESSREGLGTTTTYATAAALLTLDQEYVVNDEIHITLSQAATAGNFPSTLTCNMAGNGKSATAADTCTVTRFANTTTVGKYRFSTLTDGGSDGNPTVAGTVNFKAVGSMLHNNAETNITFHTQNSSGGIIDADVTTVVSAYNADELSMVVTKAWDGVVDVDNALKKFTSAGDGTTSDIAIWTLTNDAVNDNDAAVTGFTVVVNGDFSFLDAGATAGAVDINASTHGRLEFDTSTTGTCGIMTAATFNAAMTTATYTCTVASPTTASETVTGTWTLGSAPNAMAARTYTVDITTKYNDQAATARTEATVAAGAIGAWTENTANVTAYSVPFSNSVTRMLWISNTGSSDGAVTGTVEAGGVSYGPYALGTVAAKSNLAVGQELDTKLAADAAWTAAGYTSRANVTFSVGVSSAKVELSAGYYSTGDKDRQVLETSQKQ
jgi:hypothetical protein